MYSGADACGLYRLMCSETSFLISAHSGKEAGEWGVS